MDLFYSYIDNFEGKTIHEKQHNAGLFIIKYVAENVYKVKNSELEIINKKPKFKYSNINFSISHSKQIAAVCFDTSKIGLDIQYMRTIDFEAVSKRMNFKAIQNTKEEFYKNWTLYEAEIKLQDKVQSFKTQLLLNKYMLSVVSNEIKDIDLKIISLK